jgi:carbon monoxide dehydrogenase subunit G
MRIEGSFTLAAPRAIVWEKIRDPTLVARCVPGCDHIEPLSPTRHRARVIVAIGPIKASFNLVVEVTAEEPPARILSTTRGEEGSRASVVSADNILALAELPDGGTEVTYSSDVSITGRLGKFGLGVMKKKAEALGQQFAQAFQAQLADTRVSQAP